MAYRSLILGMVFSIGIFAAKGGMGLAFGTRGRRLRFKTCGLAVFALAYGLVFLGCALVLRYLDILNCLGTIQSLLQSGMVIHGIMAALMSIWGITLLKTTETKKKQSRGWMLLALPCPVCMASVLFSAAFFMSLFPEKPVLTLAGLYGVFLVISTVAMVSVQAFMAREDSGERPPESLLGGTMLMIAAYFLISVTVMPHVGDLDSVYRLACYRTTSASNDPVSVFVTIGLIAMSFGWGVWSRYTTARRCS